MFLLLEHKYSHVARGDGGWGGGDKLVVDYTGLRPEGYGLIKALESGEVVALRPGVLVDSVLEHHAQVFGRLSPPPRSRCPAPP